MARITLITGGARSGKSAYAQQLAEAGPAPRAYVATCPPIDDEMRERIERHRRDREGRGWDTLEEPLDLVGVLEGAAEYNTLLVECLTLWVNNLMHEAGESFGEDEMARRAEALTDACAARSGLVVLVTNEVGLGVCPANALARRYRDLVGRLNQVVAARADRAVFMAAGLPLTLKEE